MPGRRFAVGRFKRLHSVLGARAVIAVRRAGQIAQLDQACLKPRHVGSLVAVFQPFVAAAGGRGHVSGRRVVGVQLLLKRHRRNAGFVSAIGRLKRLHSLHGVRVEIAGRRSSHEVQLDQPLLQCVDGAAVAAL